MSANRLAAMGFDLVSKLLFPSPPSSYGVDSFPGELLWVPRSLGPKWAVPQDCIPCIFLRYPTARFIVVYLHSNAEDLGKCHTFCCNVREQFQVHVFAVEYPGYGICPGETCDENSVSENAEVGLRFILEVLNWPLDNVLLLGRSIGCGPTIALATEYKVSGVVVVSPMLSLKDLYRDNLGPLSNWLKERFPNKARIPLVKSPLLVVHGQKDRIIPHRHGVELYKACRSRKLLVCPPGMGHNTNLLADVSYLVLPMLQFFALPDYCFEEIVVPPWVFDKRLSPAFEEELPGALDSATHRQPGCLRCPVRRELVVDLEGEPVQRESLHIRAVRTAKPTDQPAVKSVDKPGEKKVDDGLRLSLLQKTGREPRTDCHERTASRSRLRAVPGFEVSPTSGKHLPVPASRKDLLRLLTPSDCAQMVGELKSKLEDTAT